MPSADLILSIYHVPLDIITNYLFLTFVNYNGE